MLLFEVRIKLGSGYFYSSPLAGDSEAKWHFWTVASYRPHPALSLAPRELRQRHGDASPRCGHRLGRFGAEGEGRSGIAAEEGRES